MALCAGSWMLGAWWAWHRDNYMLMAVTMGAVPVRIFLVLGWVWLVISIPGVPVLAFVLGLMWHWLVFSVPEMGMLYELSLYRQTERASQRAARPAAAPAKGVSEMKYEFVSMRSINDFDSVIVVQATPNWLDEKMGKRNRVFRYYGSGTNWRSAGDGRRCDFATSQWLHDVWSREVNRKLEAKNCTPSKALY
jgi:hypothetical protein